MKHNRGLVLVLAFALCPAGDALGQSAQRDPGIATTMVTPLNKYDRRDYLVGFWRLAIVSKDYELGVGDRIQIGVYGASELSQMLESVVIPSAGVIALPLLGDFRAAGLTAEALEMAVAERLNAKGLMEHPEVLVTVIDYQSKPVYVVGEVDNAGEYIMSQPWTLTEAILIAGGIDFTAGRYGYLHRRQSSEPLPAAPPLRTMANPEKPSRGYEVTKIDLQPMKDGGILQPDPVLKAGDIMVIPASNVETAFVIGDVMRQGGIVLPSSGTLPVSRALSVAGPTRTAKMTEGIVVRYEPGGARKELPVDFMAILEGRKPDFEVRGNDVIFVPGSNAKTLGYGLLNAIPTIITNYAIIAIF